MLPRANASELRPFVRQNVDKRARLFTDESVAYMGLGEHFEGGHHTVRHGVREYARGDVHSNTAESFFALVKRGHYGTFHQWSKRHLPRYLAEHQFRWNARKVDDEERRDLAVRGIAGKRLRYKGPVPQVS